MNSFSFLDQKGPRSLNTINKKNQTKDILNENLKIKSKIEKAKSIYSLNALDMHQKKFNEHKNILRSNSPAIVRNDPLVRKVNRSFNIQVSVAILFP